MRTAKREKEREWKRKEHCLLSNFPDSENIDCEQSGNQVVCRLRIIKNGDSHRVISFPIKSAMG